MAVAWLAWGCSLPRTGLPGGAVDAGPGRPDAARDAGPPGLDAGPPGVDAGPPAVGDAGGPDAGVCEPQACPGLRCREGLCAAYRSCSDLHAAEPLVGSGVYPLETSDGRAYDAYCEMEADGGGWTLVLKTDGNTGRFAWGSPLWTDEGLYRPGSLDLTPGNAKLEAYLHVPFAQVRVGFLDGADQLGWVLARRDDGEASSLRAAMLASEPMTLSRLSGMPMRDSDWTSQLEGASSYLQSGCGRSALPNPGGGGCGLYCAHVRIGILGNDGGNCSTPDSYMGVGGHPSDRRATPTTGAIDEHGDGVAAHGFVMVR